jgi:hypothetical protein
VRWLELASAPRIHDGGEFLLRQNIDQRVGLLAFLGDVGSQSCFQL